MEYIVSLPSKPRIVKEEEFSGVYEIDGLYPGYGHTLGNSLRRIILSSLPGAAITGVKIDGVPHEFTTVSGLKEDVITLLLNLKRVRIELLTDEAQTLSLSIKGPKKLTAKDIATSGQVRILNPEQYLGELSDKADIAIEMRVEKGLGYVSKEVLQKDRVDIGSIALDASFTPIRRVNYEVEHMRVGDRTDFNRLRIFIETDGTVTPRQALERSIEIMIHQLKAIIGFKEELILASEAKEDMPEGDDKDKDDQSDALKTRVENLDLSQRTINALTNANIRTVGGLARKKEGDILELEGIGQKGLQEIRRALSNFGLTLK